MSYQYVIIRINYALEEEYPILRNTYAVLFYILYIITPRYDNRITHLPLGKVVSYT